MSHNNQLANTDDCAWIDDIIQEHRKSKLKKYIINLYIII